MQESKIPLHKQLEIYERIKLYLANLRSHCKVCEGSGIVLNNDETFKDCEACNGKYFKYQKFLNAGLPFDYVEMPLKEFEKTFSEESYTNYKILYKNSHSLKGHHLCFHRKIPGTWGISSAAMMLLKKFMMEGLDCGVTTMADLVGTFIDFSDNEKTNKKNSEELDYYRNLQVLVIYKLEGNIITKDKGSEGFFAVKFMNFLEGRRNENKTTIFGFSLTDDEIKAFYPPKLYDYLIDNAHWFPVETRAEKMTVAERLKRHNTDLYNMFRSYSGKGTSKSTTINGEVGKVVVTKKIR